MSLPTLAGAALAQTGIFPPVAAAGSGSAKFEVNLYGLSAAFPHENLVVRFNGSPRPTKPGGVDALTVTLSAADLAQCGLAEIVVGTPDTGVASPRTLYLPIGLPVSPADFVYDQARNLIYATIDTPAAVPGLTSGTLAAIDPETCAVSRAVNVASEPGRMAISDDGNYLYVVQKATNSILRLDLPSLTPGPQFTAESSLAAGPWTTTDIAVLPQQPRTLAVSMARTEFSDFATAIFDQGVRRPKEVRSGGQLLLSPDGGFLFAGKACEVNCQSTLTRYKIDDTGLSSPVQVAPPPTGPARILATSPTMIAGGLLYTDSGPVFDALSLAPRGNLGVGGPGFVQSELNRAVVLRRADYPGRLQLEVHAFDATTDTPLGSLAIAEPSYVPNVSVETRLLHWGTDGIAFRSNGRLVSFRTPLAGKAPSISSAGIVSSASLKAGPIAPGELISIFGSNLGPAAARVFEINEPLQVKPQLGSVQVWFDNLQGTVLFANSSQINVVVPFGLGNRPATKIQVWNFGMPSEQVAVSVVPAAPGILTRAGSGVGPASILNQDGTLNSAANPASRGSIVTIYGSGFGPLTAPVVDGRILLGAGARTVIPVKANLGGADAAVQYAGGAPSLISGVNQINVTVPASAPAGPAVPLTLDVGGFASQAGVTLAIR